MTSLYPVTSFEGGNDFSLIEELDNSVEKQPHSASSNSYNVKFKDIQENNLKHCNPRSKVLPKLLPNNVRLQKYLNSIANEDLTEITLTDGITELSDSPKSNRPTKNIFKNMGISSKTLFFNNKKIMLLAPDDSYHNAKKFNHKINQINYSYISGQHFNITKFPLLKINDSDLQNEQRFPLIISKNNLKNNKNQYEFLVSPESIIKNKENHFLINNIVENKTEQNCLVNKENCSKPIENSPKNKFLNQSPTKVENSEKINYENINNMNDIHSPRDKSIDLSINLSDPDIVLHDGYIITSDSIMPNKREMNIKSVETNDSNKENRINRPIKIDRNLNENKASSSILEIFSENKEKHQYEIETEDLNKNEKLNEKVSIIYDYNPIQDIPILAPDILGKVNLRNNEKVKHFLGVKSIDENGWNDMTSIDLDNTHAKSNSVNELTLVVNSEIINNNEKDGYTDTILGLNKNRKNYQRNLNETIQNMNKKISEMEKISLSLDKDFSNSKKVHLNISETNMGINGKQKKMDDKFEKSLNLIDNCEEKSSSKFDTSVLSEFSEYSSASEILDISERLSSTNSVPKIEMFNSDNIFDESIKDSKDKSFKLIKSKVLKPSVKIKKDKFRNELEKNNYLQRKKYGKYFATEVLNQLGLPHSKSSDYPVTVVTNPSPNEMMLSEIRRNEQYNSKVNSLLPCGKKKVPKPFQERVRLQRPEITRRQNKPFTYTESLLALKPKKLKHRNLKTAENSIKLLQSNFEMSISQDTDINSICSDWTVPPKIHEIMYNKSKSNMLEHNTDDVSQIISIQSTSFIDWDQVSEMIKSLSLN